MQSARPCEIHEFAKSAPARRVRRSEANALLMELAELLLSDDLSSSTYDRHYLAKLFARIFPAADPEVREAAFHRLESETRCGYGSTGAVDGMSDSAALQDRSKTESASEAGVAPRAAPLLTGWKALAALIVVTLLVLASLAIAQHGRLTAAGPDLIGSALAGAEAKKDSGEAVNLGERVSPQFDVVRISRDGLGVVAGRAMPDRRVRILANGEHLAEVQADRRGEWAVILDKSLEPGLVALVLETPLGQDVLRSPNTLVIMRPQGEGGGGSSEHTFAAESEVLAVLTPRAGSEASRILQKPVSRNPSREVRLPSVETIEFDGEGRSVVSGRAPAGQRIAIHLNGEQLVQLRADTQGWWAFSLDRRLKRGAYRLEVENVDEKGRILARKVQPFAIGPLIEPPPGGRGIALEARETFWAMVRATAQAELRYTLIFREGAGRLPDPTSPLSSG